jgi:glycosyltransferase involved in cell wall biosynthesis
LKSGDTLIRVLHVVTSMDVGGIETMLMNLYRHIDRDKIQFDFLVHRDHKGFYEEEILELGGRIFRLVPIRLNNIIRHQRLLKRFLSNHPEHKIIHSHISINSYLILKQAKKTNVPVRIAHSHEAHKSIKEHKFFRRPIIMYSKMFINKQVTHRFACSEAAGKWLFGENSKFEVINNAIDTKKFIFNESVRKEKRKELKIEDRFVVGHIGNFSKAKNYPFILEVFNEILRNYSNAVLLLIGNNAVDPEIEKKAFQMGIRDDIVLTGVRSDIPDLLQAMDVFLFPSLFEGLGMVAVEAQASGLHCVVADTIPQEIKLTDLVEFISLTETASYWADKVMQFANGYERRNTYDEICKAGYDVIENAEWLESFYLKEHHLLEVQ